jgi:hypothetical protein
MSRIAAPAIADTPVVALNIWTNYLNEVAQTDIDFPVVNTHKAALPLRTRS